MAGTIRVTLRYGVQGLAGEHLAPNETYVLPDRFARELIASGRAVLAVDEPAPPLVPLTADAIAARDPVVSHRDPVSRKGKKA